MQVLLALAVGTLSEENGLGERPGKLPFGLLLGRFSSRLRVLTEIPQLTWNQSNDLRVLRLKS